MMKRVISTAEAPAARGQYSQGIAWGDLLFVSGQLPLEPSSGELVSIDLEAQIHQALRNLDAVLRAGGSDLARVIKTTVYITDIDHWPIVNRIYSEYFPGEPPARSVVPIKELHYGALIEIEAIGEIAR